MANIKVTTAGGKSVTATVDAEDHERLARFRWRLLPNGYVTRRVLERGKRRIFYMHREVVGSTHGDLVRVEHINGNKLDNRRANLLVKPTMSAPTLTRALAPEPDSWRPDMPEPVR